MKSVGILGVSGSVAQPLLEQLEQEQDLTRIVGIDRHPPRRHPSRLEFHPADLRQAPLARLLRGIDAVIHLAAWPGPGESAGENLRRVGAALREAGVRRWVVVTSIAAFGAHANNPVPLQEWQPLRPNPGVRAAEAWAEVERTLDELEAELEPMTLVRLRSALVVGPSLSDERSRLLTLDRVLLSRQHDPKVQLIHEADLAAACRRVLQEDASGTYHVAGLEPMTISELYQSAGARVIFLPGPALEMMTRAASRFRSSLVSPELLTLVSHPILIGTARILRDLAWEPELTTLQAFLSAREALKQG